MCKNAEKTAAALLEVAEPEFIQLLTIEGIATTPAGVAAIASYKNAEADLANFVPGTTDTVIIELIGDVTTEFQALPIPPEAKTLEGLISAALQGVLGLLNAQTTTAAAAAAATPEEAKHLQAAHALEVSENTQSKIAELAPNYKPSFITKGKIMLGDHGAAAAEWKSEYKKAAAELAATNPKYAPLAA